MQTSVCLSTRNFIHSCADAYIRVRGTRTRMYALRSLLQKSPIKETIFCRRDLRGTRAFDCLRTHTDFSPTCTEHGMTFTDGGNSVYTSTEYEISFICGGWLSSCRCALPTDLAHCLSTWLIAYRLGAYIPYIDLELPVVDCKVDEIYSIHSIHTIYLGRLRHSVTFAPIRMYKSLSTKSLRYHICGHM